MGETEPITGKYVHVEQNDEEYRTYYETNGEGTPLICLHTAGADSREYRHVLNNEDITENYQVIAFDMPYHGRSLPPGNWWEEEYRLTRDFYTGFIKSFADELNLDDPILMGNSMGGYVILDLLPEASSRFQGFIAIEPRAYEPAWVGLAKWCVHPEVNYDSIIKPFIRSLSAATAPEYNRREVDWIYNQNLGEVLAGDLWYASEDHDARESLSEIDAEDSDLFIVAGDWDYSATQEHTDYLKSEIENLTDDRVIRMEDAGHFPPSENPDSFHESLKPILERI